MPVPINESERSYICVVCVYILPLSMIVPLDFETVPIVSYFLFFILLLDNLYMACSSNGAETAYHSRAHDFIHIFGWVYIAGSFSVWCVVEHCLLLPLILLAIVLSVFDLWLLITPLVSPKAFTMFVYQQYFFITLWAFQWELSVHL